MVVVWEKRRSFNLVKCSFAALKEVSREKSLSGFLRNKSIPSAAMSSQFLKPNDNVASSLSIPNTPNMLNTRRASATMPMSAKLMSLRGDNQTPMKDSDKPVVNNIRFMQKNGRCNIKQVCLFILVEVV